MANSCRICHVSHNCVLQLNVVLLVVGIIFLVDVFSHVYLRWSLFPDLRVYPVVMRSWLFLVRGVTMVAYIGTAVVGISMAKRPSIFKFAGYILFGFIVLLYTVSLGVTRFMYRPRLKFFAHLMVYQMWIYKTLHATEEEFICCGRSGEVDYQTTKANRTWASGSCCGEPNCPGCQSKILVYLLQIQMDVARDNFIASMFLALGLVVMLAHFKDVQFHEDPYDTDDSDDPSSD
ncbi:hypothetical protein KR009_004294 [Drosophila setifemur]|nr:hypothetical protein KR009_004294 [Drosophila setifemur]